MSYILLVRVNYSLREPDGGITEESTIEEYDGDTYKTITEAGKALKAARALNPGAEIWIGEGGD